MRHVARTGGNLHTYLVTRPSVPRTCPFATTPTSTPTSPHPAASSQPPKTPPCSSPPTFQHLCPLATSVADTFPSQYARPIEARLLSRCVRLPILRLLALERLGPLARPRHHRRSRLPSLCPLLLHHRPPPPPRRSPTLLGHRMGLASRPRRTHVLRPTPSRPRPATTAPLQQRPAVLLPARFCATSTALLAARRRLLRQPAQRRLRDGHNNVKHAATPAAGLYARWREGR